MEFKIGICVFLLAGTFACKSRSSNRSSKALSFSDPSRVVAYHDDGQYVTVYECPTSESKIDSCRVSDRVVPMKNTAFYAEWDKLAPDNGPSFANALLGAMSVMEVQEHVDIIAMAAKMAREGKSDAEIKAAITKENSLKTDPAFGQADDQDHRRAYFVRHVQKALLSRELMTSGWVRVSPGIENNLTKEQSISRYLQNYAEYFAQIFRIDDANSQIAEQAKQLYQSDAKKYSEIMNEVERKVAPMCADAYKLNDELDKKRCYTSQERLKESIKSEKCDSSKTIQCSKLKSDLTKLSEECSALSKKVQAKFAEIKKMRSESTPEEAYVLSHRLDQLNYFELPLLPIAYGMPPEIGLTYGLTYQQLEIYPELRNFFANNSHVTDLSPRSPEDSSNPPNVVTSGFISHIDGIRLNNPDAFKSVASKVFGEKSFTITYCPRSNEPRSCLAPGSFKSVRVNSSRRW